MSKEIKEKLCNMCGLTCRFVKSNYDNYLHGLIDCSVEGGYDSVPGNGWGALGDSFTHTFSLCEFCLNHLFSQFKIPVHVLERCANEEWDWIPAQEKVTNDDWRRMKSEFFEEFEKRNIARNKIQK